jgi:hypothetical protein
MEFSGGRNSFVGSYHHRTVTSQPRRKRKDAIVYHSKWYEMSGMPASSYRVGRKGLRIIEEFLLEHREVETLESPKRISEMERVPGERQARAKRGD